MRLNQMEMMFYQKLQIQIPLWKKLQEIKQEIVTKTTTDPTVIVLSDDEMDVSGISKRRRLSKNGTLVNKNE
nr:hypothetical protein [Tanacetum cinerariifolium]